MLAHGMLMAARGGGSYQDLVIADGAVAFWPLDDADGSKALERVNGIDGTYVGGFTLSADTPPGVPGSVSLNGSSGYINVPSSGVLNLNAAWSLESFVFQQSTPNGSAIISDTYGAELNVQFALSFSNSSGGLASTLMLGFYNGSWKNIVGPTLSNGVWHHVVGTFDGSTLKIYVDGLQVATGAATPSGINGSSGVVIGRRWDTAGSNPYFNGRIAAAAIYKKALTANQIAAHYEAAK